MKKIFIKFIVLAVSVFMLCSCGSSAENKIVGRWDSTETYQDGKYSDSYVFYKDGNYDKFRNKEESGEKEDYTTSGHGTWSIVDKNHLRITDYAVGPTTFNFKIDGKKLILDDEVFTKGEI